ncbi:phosphatase PAP2 family protein [Paenibacillus senegalensis]|uniref:phosphatase PAP2 family protein n=1 Tax=Paenibacillus senegalensis TaxID=1465766 RepID=UPI000287D899|nr:phosphatase PAP2 family protein [Paenibacillus senegalensis]
MKSGSNRRSSFWFLAAVLVIAFLVVQFLILAHGVQTNAVLEIDTRLMKWARSITHPGLTDIMLFITWLGDIEVLTAIAITVIAILLLKRHWLESVYFCCTAALTPIFNSGLKNWLKRERPDVERIIEAAGFSFPSGHTMGAIVIYGMIGWLIGRQLASSPRRWAVGAAAVLLIALIGYSRIYLGVHYPSDIMAGLAAGASLLIISQLLLRGIRGLLDKP